MASGGTQTERPASPARPARSSLSTQTTPSPPTRDDAVQAENQLAAEQLDKLKKVRHAAAAESLLGAGRQCGLLLLLWSGHRLSGRWLRPAEKRFLLLGLALRSFNY